MRSNPALRLAPEPTPVPTSTLASPRRSNGKLGLVALVLCGCAVWGVSRQPSAAPVASVPVASAKTPAAPSTDGDNASLRITLQDGGRVLHLEGPLLDGAGERVATALDAAPDVRAVSLTSEGGLVDEAEQVGDLIAERGLVTYVPDECVSACTLAFVRGRERLVATGGRLGFHAPYEPGEEGQDVALDGADEKAAYVAAGVAPDFADEAMKTPPSDIWYPAHDRLIAAGVATRVGDGETLARLAQSPIAGPPRLASAAH